MKYFEKVRGSILLINLFLFSILGISQPCIVDAIFTFDQSCNSVEFTNTSVIMGDEDITSLLWDFGDGNSQPVISPPWNTPITNIFTNPGDYKVTLTILTEDSGGDPCETSYSQTVTYSILAAGFSTTKACLGELTQYTTNYGPDDSIVSYQWFIDDNLLSSNQNFEHTFTANGSYEVKLVVKNNHQCIDTHIENTIFELPVVDFTADVVCFGNPTHFTDVSQNAGNIATYLWEYNGIEIGSGNDFFYTMPIAGENLQVTLTTTSIDPPGCIQSNTKPIKVAQFPTAVFDANSGCLYDPFEFVSESTTGPDPIVEWLWDFDDAGSTANTATAEHTFSNTGSYDVSLTVTTDIGCSDVTSNAIIVDQPTADFITSDVCFGDMVYFDETSTATVFAEIESWHWDFGDGESLFSVLGDTNHLYTFPNAEPGYEVELIVGSNLGCFDTIVKTVFVDSIPIAGFEYDAGCIGQEVCLHDTSQPGSLNSAIVNWEWTFNGDPLAPVSDPCFTFNDIPGWYHLTLRVKSSNGCWSEELLDSIYFSNPPLPEFTASDFCFEDATIFTNTTDTFGLTGTLWTWSFGEPYLGSSDTSFLKNPWHTYTMEGDFEVTLQAESSFGCMANISHTITIDSLPFAAFSFPDTVGVNDPNVYHDNSTYPQGSPIYQWLWEFGDGGSNTNQNPIHTYTSPGTEIICLTVFNGCYQTICDTIVVVGCPNPEFYYVSNELFQTNFFDITEASENAISWYWDFGDNNSTDDTSTLQNPTWQYSESGWYQVYFRIEDKFGCEVDTIMNVYAGNSVLADFKVFGLCQGEITGFVDWSFSPVDSTYSSWYWDFGDGTDTILYEKTDTIYHQYLLPYTYHVSLTVFDTLYGIPIQDSKNKAVTTFYDPEAEIEVSSYGECLGVPISFFDVSESTDEINSWLWDFGDGYFGNTKNPVHEYDTTGAYNVSLLIETLNGCVDSTEITVNMSFTPNVDFIIENPCVNSGTRFVPNYGSDTLKITQWLWDFGDHLDTANTSIDSLPVHFYDRVDLYTVSVHMWSYDCKGEFQKTFIVLPIPYSGFSLVENYQDVQGRTKFINESIYASSYDWDFGNGNTTNVPDPIEIYEMDSTYLISLAAINEYGCADTSYYELEVFFKGLYFPTAFMPNGPNADISQFTPKGVNLKDYIVQVFDLRGSKLWESELLDENGSPVESWDGYYNDILMPEGMYIWKASGVFRDGTVWKGQTFDNETIKTNGIVTLIR